MDNMKKKFIYMLLVVMALQILTTRISTALAMVPGEVVINEIAWAGSSVSSTDEWIELYNNSSQTIDLSGWSIEDDDQSTYEILSGTISPHGYFLIEDSQSAVTTVIADAIISISLSNTGDKLVLKDSTGSVIDAVNSAGTAWFAGNSTDKSTMERLDPNLSGDLAENWGSNIIGTPKAVNSLFSGSDFIVSILPSQDFVNTGDTVSVSIIASSASDIYSYGFDLIYDPSVIKYISSTEGILLNSDSSETSFMSALENGQPGKLVVGAARISSNKGVDGSGELFSIKFEVVGSKDDSTNITFGPKSFISDSIGDTPVLLKNSSITVGKASIDPVQNLKIAEASENYSLELSWDAPNSGADSYIVQRQNTGGTFVTIGQTSELSFIDSDILDNGGKLIPNITYTYQVLAILNGVYSVAQTISGVESRGVLGDLERSGRVDGRDLDLLARFYGFQLEDLDFNPLCDTNYDGLIDGNDLIDLGANFALTI